VLHLEQASLRSLFSAGNSSRSQQVARPQVATIACVMCQQLADAPVEIAQIAAAYPHRLDVLCSHLLRLQKDLERHLNARARRIGRREIGQRRRILLRSLCHSDPIRFQCPSVTTQGEIVVAKLFARKGPSG